MVSDIQEPGGCPERYSLVGVVEHSGQQLASGHYTAYVQRGLQALHRLVAQHPNAAAESSSSPGGATGSTPAPQSKSALEGWDDITAALLSSPVQNTLPQSFAGDSLQGSSERPLSTKTSNGSEVESMHSDREAVNGESRMHAHDAGGSKTEPELKPQWYHVSDTHVSKVSPERVLGCEAYILLYMRIA